MVCPAAVLHSAIPTITARASARAPQPRVGSMVGGAQAGTLVSASQQQPTQIAALQGTQFEALRPRSLEYCCKVCTLFFLGRLQTRAPPSLPPLRAPARPLRTRGPSILSKRPGATLGACAPSLVLRFLPYVPVLVDPALRMPSARILPRRCPEILFLLLSPYLTSYVHLARLRITTDVLARCRREMCRNCPRE